MSAIFSFISSKATYILIGIIILLSLVISLQYSSSLKKDNKIDSLGYQLSSLQEINLTLEHSIKDIQDLRRAENEELEKARNALSGLQDKKQNTLKEVENAYKSENVVDAPLSPAVRGLLNEVCESVRPTGCPDP